ncbi:hypothetical protein BJX99DRAFT_261908 [Aspergillus californicus]
MASGSLHNVVSLIPRDHKMEDILRTFSDFAAYVKSNESGTLQYYAVKPEGRNELIIIEKYANRDALKHHAESEAFNTFQQEVGLFLESPPVIRRAVGFWGFENRNSAM